jgi:NAD(P)-dependent dehydrogenase (short-subunit alcohol dehydrogenase family)
VIGEFVGKAAFVTGGASGIGLALGRAFAEAGCKVMLADIEKAALDAAMASLSGVGPEIRGVVCDVADPASVDAAAEATFSGRDAAPAPRFDRPRVCRADLTVC